MNPPGIFEDPTNALPRAVAEHCNVAAYPIAMFARRALAQPDYVIITGDTSVIAPLLGSPQPEGAGPLATASVHIAHAMTAATRVCATLARSLLSAKASATARQVVIVVVLACGEHGVMLADVEELPSTPPADPVCNAPGGRA